MTSGTTPALQPIVPASHLHLLRDEQLEQLQAATLDVAQEKVRWILDNHFPEQLGDAQRAELARILQAAEEAGPA